MWAIDIAYMLVAKSILVCNLLDNVCVGGWPDELRAVS